jgi:hypothetical protein
MSDTVKTMPETMPFLAAVTGPEGFIEPERLRA